MVPDTVSFVLLALFGVVGLLFSLWRFMEVRAVSLRLEHNNIPQSGPVNGSHHEASSLLFTSGDEDQEGGRAKASFPEVCWVFVVHNFFSYYWASLSCAAHAFATWRSVSARSFTLHSIAGREGTHAHTHAHGRRRGV